MNIHTQSRTVVLNFASYIYFKYSLYILSTVYAHFQYILCAFDVPTFYAHFQYILLTVYTMYVSASSLVNTFYLKFEDIFVNFLSSFLHKLYTIFFLFFRCSTKDWWIKARSRRKGWMEKSRSFYSTNSWSLLARCFFSRWKLFCLDSLTQKITPCSMG